MNLGELFDPHWVQDGCPERYPRPRRSTPAAAPQVRTHNDRGSESTDQYYPTPPRVDETRPERAIARTIVKPLSGTTRAIVQVLASAQGELAAGEIHELLGAAAPRNRSSVAAFLVQLLERRLVERVGEDPFRYQITNAGRERLR